MYDICVNGMPQKETLDKAAYTCLIVFYRRLSPLFLPPHPIPPTRVSSKQTKIIFGSNRNKPKQDLFRVCFGLFRETKNFFFRFVSKQFVSVFRLFRFYTETEFRLIRNKQKTHPNSLKESIFGYFQKI